MERWISFKPEQVCGEKSFDIDQVGVVDFFQANDREGYRNGDCAQRKFNTRRPIDTAIWAVALHPGKNDTQDEFTDLGITGEPRVHRQRNEKLKSIYFPDMLDFAACAGAIGNIKAVFVRTAPGCSLRVKMPKCRRRGHPGRMNP